jgi:hypothetical protein
MRRKAKISGDLSIPGQAGTAAYPGVFCRTPYVNWCALEGISAYSIYPSRPLGSALSLRFWASEIGCPSQQESTKDGRYKWIMGPDRSSILSSSESWATVRVCPVLRPDRIEPFD